MRLSVNPGDVGYKAFRQMRCRGVHPMVRVNGEEVRHCITVDTKRGIAVVMDVGDDCKFRLTAKGDSVKRKILCGDVSVSFKRG